MTDNGKPTQALIPATDRAPAAYGDRGEVKALAARIMAIHPAGRLIGERGCILLAQLGLALGLNPLPGANHLHAWLDKDGFLAVHVGLEGRAALARRDSPYTHRTRPMTADERTEHDLTPADRGYVCELWRHDLTREQVALKLPVTPVVGLGIARAGERIPKGRSLAWRAEQRSLKDALRRAYQFSLPGDLAGEVRMAEDEAEIVDAEPGAPQQAQDAPAVAETAQDAAEAEHDGSTASPAAPEAEPEGAGPIAGRLTRPYDPATLRERLAGLAARHAERPAGPKQRGLFVGVLTDVWAGDPEAERNRHTVQRWLFGAESANAMTDAQILAGLDWLKPDRDSGGTYAPDTMAAREAQAVLTQALADAGQLALPIAEVIA